MTNIRRPLLRGSLIGLLLVPTVFACLVVGSFFFGYRFITAHGTSMEPTLRDGDMIWVKNLDVADVKAGDIVTLHSSQWWMTHRVIDVQPIPQEGYLLVTKGDANWIPEESEVGADEAVPVSVARIPVAGHVVDFLGSMFGRALLIGITVTLVAIWLRRRRIAHGEKRKE